MLQHLEIYKHTLNKNSSGKQLPIAFDWVTKVVIYEAWSKVHTVRDCYGMWFLYCNMGEFKNNLGTS